MATKKRITKKERLISNIRKIIDKCGATNTAELQLDCSPCYASVGNSTSLVEKFNLNDVDIVTYNKDVEIEEFTLSYDELKTDLLEEILSRLEDYDVDMDKTMKRCKD